MSNERKSYFITGIGTGVGKTVVAAGLVEALRADYWKPIQSGTVEGSDSDFVRELSESRGVIHPECYRLKAPLSPHAAAELEGVEIDCSRISIPQGDNHLIVEGAGGLFVPITYSVLMIDLIQTLGLPVMVVSRTYLGSINHTLLTIEALKSRAIPVAGVIFNGDENQATERAISGFGGITHSIRVPHYEGLNRSAVENMASLFREWLL
jgi:dethiobiotin synthetase